MNLFVAGWNCRTEERSRAVDALRTMQDTYPLLDPGSVGAWDGDLGFAAWMLPNENALGPRRYVHRVGDELLLYDGNAIDPSGRCEAHNASDLLVHWSDLTDRVEGRFIAVRIGPDGFELINDPYGIHRTFVYERDSTVWISNSMRLLARISGCGTIDLEGMAQFVGMRFIAGSGTLVQGISSLPAAQHWILKNQAAPVRNTYAPVSELAAMSTRSFGPREAETLAGEMGTSLKVLSDTFGVLECPITGGRDSRVLTGLMIAGGLPGDFFSTGESESMDVKIGTIVANRFGLPHRHVLESQHDVASAWDEISLQVIKQFDGTVTLLHATNALHTPDRLDRIDVQLYGGAGELARGLRLTASMVKEGTNFAQAVAHVQKVYSRGSRMLHPEAREAVRIRIERACSALHDEGFSSSDLPDAFDLAEFARRWGGAQARQQGDRKDIIMPFLTRPYIRAAFATPPSERLTERVPRKLLMHLSPALLALPFDRPWPPQRVEELVRKRRLKRAQKWIGKKLRYPSTGPRTEVRRQARLFVLESQMSKIRERCLDRHQSSLWQVLDRERFEYLTSDRVSRRELTRDLTVLYQAVTALTFEEHFEEWIEAPLTQASAESHLVTVEPLEPEGVRPSRSCGPWPRPPRVPRRP